MKMPCKTRAKLFCFQSNFFENLIGFTVTQNQSGSLKV